MVENRKLSKYLVSMDEIPRRRRKSINLDGWNFAEKRVNDNANWITCIG